MAELPRSGAAFLLALAACGARGSEAVVPPPNVLLVLVDTLRQDHLTPYGYAERPTTPSLQRLVEEDGAWVVDGLVAASSWTKPSVATLFTGLAPAEHGVMRLVGPAGPLRDPHTLAAEYAAAGYATGCVQANFLLARRLGAGFEAGFEVYDDAPADREDPHRGSTAAEVAERAQAWLASLPEERPWFLVLHFFDPHAAFEDHADYAWEDPAYQGWVVGGLAADALRAAEEECDAADRAQLAAYYDEEIRVVDDALGELLDTLRGRDAWTRTAVLVTSDHGEELGERGRIGHTRSLLGSLIDLPLVVRVPPAYAARWSLPEVAGGHAQAQLYAAVLGLAGIAVPAGRGTAPDGYLASEVDFEPVRSAAAEKRVQLRAVRQGDLQLIEDCSTGARSWWTVATRDAAEQLLPAGPPQGSAAAAELPALLDSHRWWKVP